MNATPQDQGWLEISVEIDPVTHEALSAFLFDLGCEGIVSESFHDPTLRAYLDNRRDKGEIRDKLDLFLTNLKEIFPGANSFKLRIQEIEEKDWEIDWRSFFRPDRVTRRLMVIPAWEPVPSSPEIRVMRIDPGPAFGTGHHATTRMCLKAMEKACFKDPWKMLDVGTGSGILAIYGVMLGAKRVAAIDIDPEALRWAGRNIELNGLKGEIELSSRPLTEWEETFSLVTANLTLGTILDLRPHFSRTLVPGGRLILSGLLREQAGEVEEGLPRYGFLKGEVRFQDEWACINAVKSGE